MKRFCSAMVGWAIGLTGAANAEIVHHVNPAPGQPGHFAWYGSLEEPRYLNVTASAAAQSNLPSGSSVAQLVWGLPAGGIFAMLNLADGGPADFARIAGVAVPSLDFEVLPLQSGDALAGRDYLDWAFYAAGYPPHSTSTFPEGESRYVGVLTGDARYGWVEVQRTGLDFHAVSWACETQPGVPILTGQIPTPGAAVVLALASLTTLQRRRR